MIKINKVNKKFGKETVIKDLCLDLPRTGLVVVYGPSGCGKTTVLNMISLLLDFEGSIKFDGSEINNLTEYQKDIYRNHKLGFIFQDYKLFEYETVLTNLLLTLDIKCCNTVSTKQKRAEDLLRMVGLLNKKNEKVFNLSGGEKQRLAVARAFSNSPSIILADEPTGNLDSENGNKIMQLLCKASRKSLVLVVSHDEELTKQFADIVYYMEDGHIKKKAYCYHNTIDEPIDLIKVDNREDKSHLPLSFCFKHTFHKFGERKWRTAFSFLTSSLALIGVGLGSVLSQVVSTNLTNSYSSLIDQNNLIIESKNKTSNKHIIEATNLDEIRSIMEPFEDVTYGVYYWNNFESMITDFSINILTNDKVKFLPDFTIRHFNDFKEINKHKNSIYPNQVQNIKENEVVLCVNYQTLNEICYQFQIQKTVSSLGKLIAENDTFLSIEVSNKNWEYEAEIKLKICGVTIGDTNLFLHSNKLWNQYIFEDELGLPSTSIINQNTKHPWDLKKSYYVESANNRDDILKLLKFDQDYKYYNGEILSKDYYPFLCKNDDVFECNRIAILMSEDDEPIPGYLSPFIKGVSPKIENIIYGNTDCYTIYSDNLLMGFGRQIFVAKDSNFLESVIDVTSYIKESDAYNLNLDNRVVEGYFTKPGNSGVVFNSSFSVFSGKKPLNYGEIVISSGLANRLGVNIKSPSNLYFAYPIKEGILPNGFISRDYKIVSLKIVGISNSTKYEINHDEEWPILFFQTQIGLSIFDLQINNLALSVEDGFENQTQSLLEKAFPYLSITCPISNIKSSIQEVCSYIETILLIISVLSVIICVLLLGMCEGLYFKDIKKDIGLIRCLGISKRESKKLIYSHAISTVIVAFLTALVELLLISFVLSKSMASVLNIEAKFVFNPISIVYMLAISCVIALLSTFFVSQKMNKLTPLDCLS